LIWKEWREVRWVLAVAAVAFVALPLAGALENLWGYRRFEFAPSIWVSWAGSILGILVGAFAAARDLQGRLADFWRSRPIGVVRQVVVKYAVGIATLLIACLVPLAIEAWSERWDPHPSHAAAALIKWLPMLLVVQFSLGFVCGCLTRRTGPAVMLAFGLTLLFYFLPVVLPFMHGSSLMDAVDNGQAAKTFIVTAAAVSLGALLLAILGVRQAWHLRAGQGLMYWSIAGVLLLLFASAAFQVASNLPVLQEVDLDPGESVLAIRTDGHRGMLVTRLVEGQRRLPDGIRTVEITSSGLHLGTRIPVPFVREGPFATGIVWLPDHPDVCFTTRATGEHGPRHVALVTLPLGEAAAQPIGTAELGTSYDPDDPNLPNLPAGESWAYANGSGAELYGAGNTLLAIWWKGPRGNDGRAIVDVADPAHPRVISSNPPPIARGFGYTGRYSEPLDQQGLVLTLPPLPGVPVEQRLRVAIDLAHGYEAALDGRILAFTSRDSLLIYELARVSETPGTFQSNADYRSRVKLASGSAEFHRVGKREPSLAEQLLGGWGWSRLAAGNGFVYASKQVGVFGRPLARVAVLDIRDPSHPRPAGHFATPGDSELVVHPLTDGRALIGGRKLYLVGPPPSRARS
jgi:hypothetical protein